MTQPSQHPATPAQPAAAASASSAAPWVRPVQPEDLPALQRWLPARAAHGLPAAADPAEPADPVDPTLPDPRPREAWLVAGWPGGPARASLRARRTIGLQQPRYWYHRGCVVHAAPELQLFQRQEVLLLGNDLTGLDELADPAWDPALDEAAIQALLAGLIEAGLRWLAAPGVVPPPAYADQCEAAEDALPTRRAVLVELPGWTDEHGESPLWQGLGRHFYQGDPGLALQTFGPGWVSHLAALLPRQAVYTAFLEPAALAALGRLADSARPAARALRAAGFLPGEHVRVDDGGPVLLRHARLEDPGSRPD
jgi:arginine N-succinyltransferase